MCSLKTSEHETKILVIRRLEKRIQINSRQETLPIGKIHVMLRGLTMLYDKDRLFKSKCVCVPDYVYGP